MGTLKKRAPGPYYTGYRFVPTKKANPVLCEYSLVSKSANYPKKTYSLASIEKNVIIGQR